MSETTQAADDIYSLFESDPTAESEGVWVQYGRSRFRVRSINSPGVTKIIMGQVTRQARIREANNRVLPDYLVAENDAEIAAGVVTAWEDVPHFDRARRAQGELLPYSTANAKALFGQPALHKLRTALIGDAQNFDNYRRGNQEALEGNSPPASDGSASEAQPAP